QVVRQVALGLGGVHPSHGVTQGDALVERGEGAEFDPPAQGWLPNQQRGERAAGVKVGVGQQPQFFELVGVEQVRLVDHEHDGAAAFVVFGGEQVHGL